MIRLPRVPDLCSTERVPAAKLMHLDRFEYALPTIQRAQGIHKTTVVLKRQVVTDAPSKSAGAVATTKTLAVSGVGHAVCLIKVANV